MKASRPISHDRHPAILILRVATIFASIVCVVAFAWMFRAHDEVYTDSVGSFLTLFPLIFVRLFLPRTDYRNANQATNRQHTPSSGPS